MQNTCTFTGAAIEIAEKAGNLLHGNQSGALDIQHKGDIDLITRMDRESEEMITRFIKQHFPQHQIMAEEGTVVEQDNEYTWIIDPLDGTTNYAHGLPWYSVSIALMKSDHIITGVVFNPANGELFYARKDHGSYLGKLKLKVSGESKLSDSLLVTGFPYYIKKRSERVIKNFTAFLGRTQGIRRFGSAALDLCSVAAGRYEGFWEEGLKPWDTAAGILIIKEAGGKITNYAGEKFHITGNTIIASNGLIHEPMLDIIKPNGIGD